MFTEDIVLPLSDIYQEGNKIREDSYRKNKRKKRELYQKTFYKDRIKDNLNDKMHSSNLEYTGKFIDIEV